MLPFLGVQAETNEFAGCVVWDGRNIEYNSHDDSKRVGCNVGAMAASPKELRRQLMTGSPSTGSPPARRGTLEVGQQMQRLQQEDPRLSNIDNRLKRIQQLGWAAGSAPPTPTGKASGGLGSKLLGRQQQAGWSRP